MKALKKSPGRPVEVIDENTKSQVVEVNIIIIINAQLKTHIKAAEAEFLLKLHKDKPMHGIFYKHLEEHGTLVFLKHLENVTSHEGKMIRLECEVKNLDTNSSNSKVTFNWRHNGAPANANLNERFKVRNKGKDNIFSSTLRISKLEYFDRGFVECIANNGVDRIRSSAVLEVNGESHKPGK
nr:unnamed protein product [Callosobruchus analis]